MAKRKASARKGKRAVSKGKAPKSRKVSRKVPRKALTLAQYLKRYGAPKKGSPRRAAYERSATFKKRQRARVARPIAGAALGRFLAAREAGDSSEIKAAHKTWLDVRKVAKKSVTQSSWRAFMDRYGEEYDLDESFLDALDESPESESA
jgi:hypothetical protein